MGLDNFWIMEGEHPVFEPELNLVGGILSGHGSGSFRCGVYFRGGVYDDLVEAVSGISLYQEKISSEECLQIADALENFSGCPLEFCVKEDHVPDLVRMFRTYGEAGAVLKGWW